MKNEIKTNILSRKRISDLINFEDINLLNSNITEFEINKTISQNDIRTNNLEKAKELLKKILKENLDVRLSLLEKNLKSHINQLETTSDLTKTLTKLTTKMNKQILEKLKKDKENQSKKTNKNTGNRKGYSPYKSGVSKNRNNNRSKTPKHFNSKSKGNNYPDKTPISKREIKNKANFTLIKNTKAIDTNKTSHRFYNRQRRIGSQTKSSLNINKKSHNDLDDLHSLSITSVKTNKTNNTTTLNTISNSKINNKLNFYKNSNRNIKQNDELSLQKTNNPKMKKHNTDYLLSDINSIYMDKKTITENNSIMNLEDKKKRKKTPFKKKSDNNEEKIINTIKKRKKTIADEIYDILSMETNLEKEIDLDNNDPLLILPLKDLDFVPKNLLRRNSVRMDNPYRDKKYAVVLFNIQKNLEKIKINNILKYLSLYDLLSIKNISKRFHQIIIVYIIDYFEKEQIKILEIKNTLNINEVPDRKGIENLVLSNQSKKAIQLLNEAQINNIFKDNQLPIDDILLIYRIYFQMINHPFALIAKTDLDKFWDKCKYYFKNELNGKIGDILVEVINNKKIETNRNNLYQIYNLVRGNWNKINPKYFSSEYCSTILFVIIIKDILEFLGLSLKVKQKENAYWTYSDIIESIKDKINSLKKYKT